MTQIYDVPRFEEFSDSHRRLIDDIVMLADIPRDLEKVYIRNPIHKFMRRVFITPGSQSHHDCESGGLVHHVLEVIRQTLSQARRDPTYESRDRLAAFACALLHDACRPYHLVVRSVPGKDSPPDAPVSTWIPCDSTMARWVQNNHIKHVSMSWEENREVYGQSEGAAVFLMGVYFPESFFGFVGQHRITRIAKALLTKAPESGEELYRLFKGADRLCVAANSRSIGRVDCERLRQALYAAISRVATWNEHPFRFLASTTHAVLPFPTTKFDEVGILFWREVFDLIATQTGRSPQVHEIGVIMLDVFRDDLVSLGRPSWGKDEFVAHAVVEEKTFACIALPWGVVTGPGAPRPNISTHPPAWRLRTRNAKHRLAVSIEDLGFQRLSDSDAHDQHLGFKIADLLNQLVPNPTTRDELLVTQDLSTTKRVPRDHQDLALSIILSKFTAKRSSLVAQRRSGSRRQE